MTNSMINCVIYHGSINKNCADLRAYRYASPTIPDKEWAVAVHGMPQDINSIYGNYMRFFNVTAKNRFRQYQIAYDKWIVQRNIARSFELERECYKDATTFLSHERNQQYMGISYIVLDVSHVAIEEISDPNQRFIPSHRLVEIVYRQMPRSDNDIELLLSEISSTMPTTIDETNEIEVVKELIADHVENMLTKRAKRASYANEKDIVVGFNNRFTPEIGLELVDRLGLDIYIAPEVLKLLYDELLTFLSVTPRERVWGRVYQENTTIKLEVKKGVFTLPKFPSIDDQRWLIT